MIRLLPFLLFVLSTSVHAQNFKVLHYTETSGFDHQTRDESLSMFQDLASTYSFQVDDDQTGDTFNSLTDLEEYDLVVFSNTSGDAILNASQRANFETYINNGGSYLGMHAASDTYRHSTANGSSTGTWDFYAELVGASVQQSPNHVSGTPQYTMNHLMTHASTANLPDPWVKNEEYYYWENGYYGTDNSAVLEVEETVGPNNMVNSYDAARPMSWFRELSGGGRMFYTALGHSASNYTSNQNFINHIRDAMLWIVDAPVSVQSDSEQEETEVTIKNHEITISGMNPSEIVLRDILGKTVAQTANSQVLETEKLPAGLYLLEAFNTEKRVLRKLYLN